jgi:hypothetical protein
MHSWPELKMRPARSAAMYRAILAATRKQGKVMKTSTIVAIALGVGALAACNKSPTEQAAENVESNYANAAENIEATTSNAGEALEANAANAASAVNAVGQNAASAVKNEGKEKANAVRNSTATGNTQ